MINKHVRFTAGILTAFLMLGTVPVDALASPRAEESEYISSVNVGFSAGVHSAINQTVIVNNKEDDSLLADGNTGVTENDTPIVTDPQEPEVDPIIKEGPYGNIAIANLISAYLNVREEPNTDAKVVGKLYENNAAFVEEVCGEWLKITSGNVSGYIHGAYVTVGDEELCKSVSTVTAKVLVKNLRIRKEPTTESGILTMLALGKKVQVLDQSTEGWIKVKHGSYIGYISAEFAEVTVAYSYGETKAEEAARIAAEEAEKKRQEEEKKKQEAAEKEYKDPTGKDGQALVDYALQFLGTKYVWGGESLTKGVDCSGFVMKVFEKFGYKVPHSSYKLRSVGRAVKESEIQPGDIVCYNGHVAIYIGNGKIVHSASNKKGVVIGDNWKFNKVLAIRRILQ